MLRGAKKYVVSIHVQYMYVRSYVDARIRIYGLYRRFACEQFVLSSKKKNSHGKCVASPRLTTPLFGERERAYLVVQLARYFAIYIIIYIYGRALHIPYISKCFYVNFFKRYHRVQRSTSISSLANNVQHSPSIFLARHDR